MDHLFRTLAANLDLPAGWGFPATVVRQIETPMTSRLARALIPFDDQDGRAQLVRWYYGIIQAFPDISLGMGAGMNEYDPGLAWKPPLEIHGPVGITADPGSGMLTMDWVPDGSTGSMTGKIVTSGSPTLTLGNLTAPLGPIYKPLDSVDAHVLAWPSFMNIQAALSGDPDGAELTVVFRPTRFDAAGILETVSPLVSSGALVATGLTGLWHDAVPEEKLAIAWAIVQHFRNA